MHVRFNFEKALQASSILLHLDGYRMSRLRLLKLLYIADRESLLEVGQSITGDQATAMKYGPVLSRTYDLVRGISSRAGDWDNVIHSDGYAVVLRDEPGRGNLTRYEIEKLTEVSERYRGVDDFDLSELTHEFPEWSRNYREETSTPIPWDHVLEAHGKEEFVPIVEEAESIRQCLDDLFGPEP